MKTPAKIPAVAAIVVLFGTAAATHHSRSGYDSAKESLQTHNGVISSVKWQNPHVYIFWDVKDSSGNVVQWTGEFSSPSTMISEGVSRTTFKIGEPVTVTVMPARAGTLQGLVIKVVRLDGSVIIDLSNRRGLLEQ
jgi:hypothetical protein